MYITVRSCIGCCAVACNMYGVLRTVLVPARPSHVADLQLSRDATVADRLRKFLPSPPDKAEDKVHWLSQLICLLAQTPEDDAVLGCALYLKPCEIGASVMSAVC